MIVGFNRMANSWLSNKMSILLNRRIWWFHFQISNVYSFLFIEPNMIIDIPMDWIFSIIEFFICFLLLAKCYSTFQSLWDFSVASFHSPAEERSEMFNWISSWGHGISKWQTIIQCHIWFFIFLKLIWWGIFFD